MPHDLAVTVLPVFDALAHNERGGAFAIRIDPPPLTHKRAPLRLVLAIDVSGSMLGGKLASAIAAAQAVVQALSPDDTFGCITFNGKATVLQEPTAMTAAGKALTIERLARIEARGNTNIAAAMLRSFELLAQAGGSGRVLLLTDGCPTEGVTAPDQLQSLVAGSSKGNALSTFGFGRDVNPLLLLSLAETARGNYTFIEAGEPPVAAIAAELGGLVATVAAQATLTIELAPHVALDRIFRTGPLDTSAGLRLELPALIAEEPVYLCFSLRWAEQALGQPLGRVHLHAYSTDTGAPVSCSTELRVKHDRARGPLNAEACKELILARASVALFQASNANNRGAHELSTDLALLAGELSGTAELAGISDDAQIKAALALLAEARRGLEDSAPQSVRNARQDMVASSYALKGKRSTVIGAGAVAPAQAAFATRSQVAGVRMVTGSAMVSPPDPDKKP